MNANEVMLTSNADANACFSDFNLHYLIDYFYFWAICDKINILWSELSLHIFRKTHETVELYYFYELPSTCQNAANYHD